MGIQIECRHSYEFKLIIKLISNLFLTIVDGENDWLPGGDGNDVIDANLLFSGFSDEVWADIFLSWISVEEKLVFRSEILVETCWAIAVVPPADVRRVEEDEVGLN